MVWEGQKTLLFLTETNNLVGIELKTPNPKARCPVRLCVSGEDKTDYDSRCSIHRYGEPLCGRRSAEAFEDSTLNKMQFLHEELKVYTGR